MPVTESNRARTSRRSVPSVLVLGCRWLGAAAAALALTGCLATAAHAGGYVYWTANGSTFGRANLNGTAANQRFIAGASRPRMLAVTARYIYWASDNNTIGRANRNGTAVNQRFIIGASGPVGVAVNSNHVYWANNGTGTIGRANLNGTGAEQRLLTARGHPRGVAVNSGS